MNENCPKVREKKKSYLLDKSEKWTVLRTELSSKNSRRERKEERKEIKERKRKLKEMMTGKNDKALRVLSSSSLPLRTFEFYSVLF